MSTEQSGRERDLILAPNQFANIQDETKGNLTVYVGANKTSLANTDRPVVYNPKTRKFERASLDQAIQEFPLAQEGSYIVLENPAMNAESAHPPPGSNVLPKLSFGRKINIPGPVTFALWPGQTARVIEGHRLRSNQFLVIRVYSEAEAQANWSKSVMVMKPSSSEQSQATGDGTQTTGEPGSGEQQAKGGGEASGATLQAADLTIGKLLIIKGTEVSFYIPPTGIEVVPDVSGNYVREAVTLERLEYCILLDEGGAKRYVIGPDVVFPKPTETFIEKDGGRKFRAIELNDDMGIYVKVIADYKEGDHEFKTGDELFITGRDQRIYYPREEHALIKYGEQERHYGVVIPDGEARYVLDKDPSSPNRGNVNLVRGPGILLPDPRKQVIMRRVLEEREVALWYPGNAEAAGHNANIREIVRKTRGSREEALSEANLAAAIPVVRSIAANASFAGDELQRGKTYTPPRTLTLDTKYEGAVAINVWTGFAILAVDKSGGRRVVIGPKTALLEYDETLQVLELSTGTPKSDMKLQRTVYLRVQHNQVSDKVTVVTGDMVDVEISVSYRVDFEGDDPEKWFHVENYVKFLCDHARSKLRAAAKGVGIQEFNDNAITIVRDTLLGKAEGGKRAGLRFEENGMRVYDVEVLGVAIGDKTVADSIVRAQHETVSNAMTLARKERELLAKRRTAEIDREILSIDAETAEAKALLEKDAFERTLEVALAKIAVDVDTAKARLVAKLEEQKTLDGISSAEMARRKAQQEQDLAYAAAELAQRLEEAKAEIDGVVAKAGAIGPDLVAAMQAFGDKQALGDLAKAFAPLAIIGGSSLTDVAMKLLQGTKILPIVEQLTNGGATNGSSTHA